MIEYRLYYNDDGSVIEYTTENRLGNYILVTADDYAISDMHALVKDGKLTRPLSQQTVYHLSKTENGIYKTSKQDVSVLVEENHQHWDLITHEL